MLRLAILLSVDALIVVVCYFAAFVLRLEDLTLKGFAGSFYRTAPILLAIIFASFKVGGMYREVWRFATVKSALVALRCMVAATAIFYLTTPMLPQGASPPRSVPIIFAILSFFGVTGVRFSWRLIRPLLVPSSPAESAGNKEHCFIYGAGRAGELLARHISADPKFPYQVMGFLDDDASKKGRTLHGFRIFIPGSTLAELARDRSVSTVILAMHAMPGKVVRELVAKCHAAGLKPLIMPDMASSLSADPFRPRVIDVKDLLRRAPKSTDLPVIRKFFSGQTVLVTGAGGSIGSELCRQIFQLKPSVMILFEASEYNLYRIEQELREQGKGSTRIIPVLGSVRDARAVENVFRDYEPTCVIHAAAYKHVSLVEQNPFEGILNNVLGTKILAEMAVRYGAAHFLLISTDKAVRPTSVMGATKRCCELVVQAIALQKGNGCRFSSVRFGNVLGSSGSVIPKFTEQIQQGRPVTVTDPEVTRYFMLIPEAAALCLQSLAMARGGEIFVLNMGEPVKIYEMAKQLILLAGKKLGQDIDIVFTGLQPGEKLYEELILEGAEKKTIHEDVFVATPHPIDVTSILTGIKDLLAAAEKRDEDECRQILWRLAMLKKRSTQDSEPLYENIATQHQPLSGSAAASAYSI